VRRAFQFARAHRRYKQDLRSGKEFWKKSDTDVREAFRGGAGVGLSPFMPPWGQTLNDRQIDDLILYCAGRLPDGRMLGR